MFLLTLSLFACGTEASPEASSAPAVPIVALPPSSGGSAAPAPAAASAGVLVGTVAETVPAGSYTYVRATVSGTGDVWAASTGAAPAVGAEVRISTALPMKNFHSESLNRDFDVVYFVENYEGGAAGGSAAALPSGHPSVGADAATKSVDDAAAAASAAPVTGAPAGAKTVAEVWKGRKDLAGREVTVSGKVVKFTRGVLGKNWAHVQDGTGDVGTNDLTVTTNGEAVVGDTVTATGVVAVDRDFGAGYTYDVIVTDAALTVKK